MRQRTRPAWRRRFTRWTATATAALAVADTNYRIVNRNSGNPLTAGTGANQQWQLVPA
ncbi:hypothetical protein [Amycolatopsis sp. CA-126428]|uniref:hypothetical protein n=1 Tax=Amycolatopsis sp. CA-126428 TaxID=2073158 RepID=UPI0013049287|nr:hypothetical protein [Amycolatopsis sp. CA-126428]